MVFLGLALLLLGAVVVLAAVFVSKPGTGGELLGFEVTTLQTFLVGLAAGAALLWGFTLLRWGTRRTLAHRQERKELSRQNAQLMQEQAARDERTVPIVDKRTEDDRPA
jgi:hypothetical protein